jgi:hypothetical protein
MIETVGQQIASTSTSDRPAEPDHPMVLEGGVVPGDTRFMMTCLFEEMLQAGITPRELAEMSVNPRYQALYAGRIALGDEATNSLLAQTAQRIGVHRVRTREALPCGDPESSVLIVSSGSFEKGN